MRIFTLFLGLCILIWSPVFTQSTAFVPQGGLTVGLQRNSGNSDRQSLLAWHAALAIESVNNEADKASLMLQIGYHVKGSATRFRTVNVISGIQNGQFTEEFQYHNFSLMLGAKSKKPLGDGGKKKWYYFGGVRGDYTYSTNIDELASRNPSNAVFYPQIGAMNRWMVGVSAGAGLEFKFTELIGGEVKFTIAPDFTSQVNQQQSPPLINPFDPNGLPIVVPAQQIRNVALELSFGLRLLRKVEFVD